MLAVALLALLAAIPASAFTSGHGQLPSFDVRDGAVLPAFSAGERKSQRDLSRQVGQPTASGRVVAGRDGVRVTGIGAPLTAPARGDRAGIGLRFVRTHAVAFGLTGNDVDALRVESRYTDWSGVTHVTWTQSAGGITSYDNEVGTNVAKDGSLINAWSTAIPGFTGDGGAKLSAGAALGVASHDVSAPGPAPRAGASSGPEQKTEFSNGASAHLTLFGGAGGTRLAWDVTLMGEKPNLYEVVVDAQTGEVLARVPRTAYANNASVWERSPGAPLGGTANTVDLAPYLSNTTGADGLKGPNAWAWSDTTDDCFLVSSTALSPGCAGPGSGEGVATSSGTDFTFSVASFDLTAAFNCPAAEPNCTWDPATGNSWATNRAQNATQAFYYANRFHDHLAAAPIGFNSGSRNFEAADPVLVNSDDGANGAGNLPDANHRNNANMATPEDGTSPVMQMYLFKPVTGAAFRSVNGGDDAIVVYHEYTHGLSNRLIGNGHGLSQFQPGSMGEAWSDWYAFDFEVAQGFFTDTSAPGELDADAYVTKNDHLIRTQPIDCPVGGSGPSCPGTPEAGPGGYTFGDLGKIIGGPEVHADGEIWGETLWDLRTAVGSAVAERIVTDAMRNSPTNNPTFLDERDLILAADLNAFGGAHRAAIWQAFAGRGMGWKATTPGASSAVTEEDFSVPELLALKSAVVTDPPPGGDGDGFAEPGETVQVTPTLQNAGPQTITNALGTLQATLGVAGTAQHSFTPASIGIGVTATSPSYTLTIPQGTTCGAVIDSSLLMQSGQGSFTVPVPVTTGRPGTPNNVSYTGGPAAIPDNSNAGVDVPIAVSGVSGNVAGIKVTIGSLTHTFDRDLAISLVSPTGKTVRLVSHRGGSSDSFTNTILDDAAPNAISTGTAPFTGSFRPEQPLAGMRGEPINGTWKLHVIDTEGGDTGQVNSWSLELDQPSCPAPPVSPATSGPSGVVPFVTGGTVKSQGASFSFTSSPKTLTLDSTGSFRWSFAALPGTSGQAVFQSAGKVAAKVQVTSAKKRKKRVLKLGKASFSVGASGRSTVRIRLSKANQKALKRLKKVKVKVTLTAGSDKATTTFTLKPARKKKR